MRSRRSLLATATTGALIFAAEATAAVRPGDYVSFVACPIAQDIGPEEDLCFFSEHGGERFSLRTQILEDLGPLLRHKVLVEGMVRDEPRACDGWQLEGMTSSLPELTLECNEVRPQRDVNRTPPPAAQARQAELTARIRANPQLSIEPAPFDVPEFEGAPPTSWEMLYNFDSERGNGPSLQALVVLVQEAARKNAGRIRVRGYRGASKLESGEVMEEPEGIAKKRAEKIAGIIAGLGYPAERIQTRWSETPARPDGKADWKRRRVTVEVTQN
jgi:hypothetical protein